MKPIVLLKLSATALLVALIVIVAMHPRFLLMAGVDYFFFTTLLGVVLIHLRLRPKLVDLAAVVGGSALLCLLAPRMVSFHVTSFAFLSLPGLVSFAVLAVRWLWTEKTERQRIAIALATAVCFVSAGWLTAPMLKYVNELRPLVLDLYLYSFDASLLVQISFLLGKAFLHWHWFAALSIWCYIGLSLILALVFAENLVRDARRAVKTATVFLFCGPIGVTFYAMFPGLGPRVLLRKDFPLHPLTSLAASQVLLQPIALEGARNAIPSLHMTWVLLAWWCSERTSLACRIVAALFVVFTVTSTMGTGEHYFIDLVVAAPFTLFLYSLFCAESSWRDFHRWTAILSGLAMVLAWFALLRHAPRLFWISPVIPWILVVLTMVATAWLKHRLEPAAFRADAAAHDVSPAGMPLEDVPAQ